MTCLFSTHTRDIAHKVSNAKRMIQKLNAMHLENRYLTCLKSVTAGQKWTFHEAFKSSTHGIQRLNTVFKNKMNATATHFFLDIVYTQDI